MIVLIQQSAEAQLNALPEDVHHQFDAMLTVLRRSSLLPVGGLKLARVRGTSTLWRLRVGDYRGTFRYRDDARSCYFLAFGPRYDTSKNTPDYYARTLGWTSPVTSIRRHANRRTIPGGVRSPANPLPQARAHALVRADPHPSAHARGSLDRFCAFRLMDTRVQQL